MLGTVLVSKHDHVHGSSQSARLARECPSGREAGNNVDDESRFPGCWRSVEDGQHPGGNAPRPEPNDPLGLDVGEAPDQGPPLDSIDHSCCRCSRRPVRGDPSGANRKRLDRLEKVVIAERWCCVVGVARTLDAVRLVGVIPS